MINKIYKYPLKITDEQAIKTLRGVQPLCVQMQDGGLCLWCEVDESAADLSLQVRVIGTGNPMPSNMHCFDYVGTVQDFHRRLVWHVYVQREIDRD